MALARPEVDQFIANARIKLVGASEAGIKSELFEVLKEFFDDSNAWREDIQFQAEANTDTYLLSPRYDGQIIRLIGIWDAKGISIPAFMPDFGTVRLLHAPSNTPPSPYFARVVKSVVLPTTKDDLPIAPDWTLRVYSIHILDGLLGKMMSQQQKSYSNEAKSIYHLRRFRTGIQIARTEAARANGVGNQEWAFPSGFTRGSQRGGVSTAWPTQRF